MKKERKNNCWNFKKNNCFFFNCYSTCLPIYFQEIILELLIMQVILNTPVNDFVRRVWVIFPSMSEYIWSFCLNLAVVMSS